MKWFQAAASFLFVAAGVFFIVGWCLLPPPILNVPETSRLDRLAAMMHLDWAHNVWGFVLAPLLGALSAWLTIRRCDRNSRP